MEIENKNLEKEQQDIERAFDLLRLQFKFATNNISSAKKRLEQFHSRVKDEKVKAQLSNLLDMVSASPTPTNTEIVKEIELIYETIFGHPMKIEEETSLDDNKTSVVSTNESPLSESSSSPDNHVSSVEDIPQSIKPSETTVEYPPAVSETAKPQTTPTTFSFTRTDGSKVKLEVLYHVGNVYYSKLTRCKVTQTFPNLPHGSDIEVITEITTVIDLEAFQNSPEYRAQIKASLSAQNIYDAAANHSTFLHKGIPAFNSSNKQLLEYTENQLERERFTSCEPFDSQYGSLKRLLPVCEFKASAPLNFKQYEYSLSGLDLPHTSLEYLYSNIDMEKLYNNANYKAFILSQIRKCELSEDSYSFFLIGSPNVLGDYTAITDSTLSKFITAYRDYVSNRQFSTDDEEPGNH